mmetsp:Transcript_79340/g.155237  ORF Transcript_79340/g.155237 Transcript_79340/m.155237 type:complete len:256 (-) Transcript_79340:189-956(-)
MTESSSSPSLSSSSSGDSKEALVPKDPRGDLAPPQPSQGLRSTSTAVTLSVEPSFSMACFVTLSRAAETSPLEAIKAPHTRSHAFASSITSHNPSHARSTNKASSSSVSLEVLFAPGFKSVRVISGSQMSKGRLRGSSGPKSSSSSSSSFFFRFSPSRCPLLYRSSTSKSSSSSSLPSPFSAPSSATSPVSLASLSPPPPGGPLFRAFSRSRCFCFFSLSAAFSTATRSCFELMRPDSGAARSRVDRKLEYCSWS